MGIVIVLFIIVAIVFVVLLIKSSDKKKPVFDAMKEARKAQKKLDKMGDE